MEEKDVCVIPDTPSPVFKASSMYRRRADSKKQEEKCRQKKLSSAIGKKTASVTDQTSHGDGSYFQTVGRGDFYPKSGVSDTDERLSPVFGVSPVLSFPGTSNFAQERAEAIRKKKHKDRHKLSPFKNGYGHLSCPLKSNPYNSSPAMGATSTAIGTDEKLGGFVRSSTLISPTKLTIYSTPYASTSTDLNRQEVCKRKTKQKAVPIEHKRVKLSVDHGGWPSSSSDSSDNELLLNTLTTNLKPVNKQKKPLKKNHSASRNSDKNINTKPNSDLFHSAHSKSDSALCSRQSSAASTSTCTLSSAGNIFASGKSLNLDALPKPFGTSQTENVASFSPKSFYDKHYNGLRVPRQDSPILDLLPPMDIDDVIRSESPMDVTEPPMFRSNSASDRARGGNNYINSVRGKEGNGDNKSGKSKGDKNDLNIRKPRRARPWQNNEVSVRPESVYGSSCSAESYPEGTEMEGTSILQLSPKDFTFPAADLELSPITAGGNRRENRRKQKADKKGSPVGSKDNPIAIDSLTPQTERALNNIQQLQSDEEIARKLQEELDREYAMSLQDRNEATSSPQQWMPPDLPTTRPQQWRPPDSPTFSPQQWQPPPPLDRGRQRGRRVNQYDTGTDVELFQLLHDTVENMQTMQPEVLNWRPPRQARRGRGRRNAMAWVFGSPDGGNDYEHLMNLADMIGDAKEKGLSKAESGRLPTVSYQKKESPEECNICMTDYEQGDLQKILPCFHSYHSACIDKWIMKNATCPVCRVAVNITTP